MRRKVSEKSKWTHDYFCGGTNLLPIRAYCLISFILFIVLLLRYSYNFFSSLYSSSSSLLAFVLYESYITSKHTKLSPSFIRALSLSHHRLSSIVYVYSVLLLSFHSFFLFFSPLLHPPPSPQKTLHKPYRLTFYALFLFIWFVSLLLLSIFLHIFFGCSLDKASFVLSFFLRLYPANNICSVSNCGSICICHLNRTSHWT